MRKKLIIALVVALILIAAAVGVIIYMESCSADIPVENNETTSAPEQIEDSAPTEETDPVEETVILSLPTENPDEAAPEDTFGDDNVVPPVTVDPDVPATTEDPNANALPEDEF